MKLGLLVFLHPQSPAAVWRNPRSLPTNVLGRALNLYLRIADRLSARKKVTCNVCGEPSRRFGYATAVSVHAFRPDDICLRCGSNHRTRTLVALLGERVNFASAPMTVADAGAAKCTRRYFERFPNVRYLTVDRFKDSDIISDVTDIRLPDDSVDAVVCCHTLEHVADYQKAIGELHRILKPGHVGIIGVPQNPHLDRSRREREETFLGYGHLWEFGDDFASTLREAGFDVQTVHASSSAGTSGGEYLPYHVVTKRSPSRGSGSARDGEPRPA
jgi:SAM-dependent methyltransferase